MCTCSPESQLYQKQPGRPVEEGDSAPPFPLLRPHLDYCIQFWGHQHRKDVEDVRAGPEEGRKKLIVLEYFSYEDRVS